LVTDAPDHENPNELISASGRLKEKSLYPFASTAAATVYAVIVKLAVESVTIPFQTPPLIVGVTNYKLLATAPVES